MVVDVIASAQPSTSGRGDGRSDHLVILSSVDDDGLSDELRVFWELEGDARILAQATLPEPHRDRLDDPSRLAAFLDAVRRRDAVRCITAHSAKGLEFGDLYVVGADDGSFPLVYADASEDERAEKVGIDGRLLYVAVTRAKQRLTILCGSRPSPFLAPALAFAAVEDAR